MSWTYTGGTEVVKAYHGNPDGGHKATSFPAITAGEATWWTEFAHRISIEFAKEVAARTSTASTLSMSANNGAGDTNGVGTLTITLIVA